MSPQFLCLRSRNGWHPERVRNQQPILFAHRGGMAHHRENSIAAFVHARQRGVGGIETDAWLSADGDVILDHDGIFGSGHTRRTVAMMARAQLPAAVPTIDDLWDAVGTEMELSIDVLDSRAAAVLVERATARADAVPGRLWLCHPDVAVLSGWRRLHPAIHLVHSPDDGRSVREQLAAHTTLLSESGIDVLNLRCALWNARAVETVHAAGLLAFGWDAQTVRAVRRLDAAGVDGIMGDRVDRLLLGISPR